MVRLWQRARAVRAAPCRLRAARGVACPLPNRAFPAPGGFPFPCDPPPRNARGPELETSGAGKVLVIDPTLSGYIHRFVACMHTSCMYACMRACMNPCVHESMHACIHARMHACMCVCIHVFSLYACLHAFACVCVYLSMFVCMCMTIYMHVYIAPRWRAVPTLRSLCATLCPLCGYSAPHCPPCTLRAHSGPLSAYFAPLYTHPPCAHSAPLSLSLSLSLSLCVRACVGRSGT
jgi:hypothetical protein